MSLITVFNNQCMQQDEYSLNLDTIIANVQRRQFIRTQISNASPIYIENNEKIECCYIKSGNKFYLKITALTDTINCKIDDTALEVDNISFLFPKTVTLPSS